MNVQLRTSKWQCFCVPRFAFIPCRSGRDGSPSRPPTHKTSEFDVPRSSDASGRRPYLERGSAVETRYDFVKGLFGDGITARITCDESYRCRKVYGLNGLFHTQGRASARPRASRRFPSKPCAKYRASIKKLEQRSQHNETPLPSVPTGPRVGADVGAQP